MSTTLIPDPSLTPPDTSYLSGEVFPPTTPPSLSSTPDSTLPSSTSESTPQERPTQSVINRVFNYSIRTLAQCDEDYCEDADLRYHTALLQYVLKAGPDEWEPLLALQSEGNEDKLEKYLTKAFKRYDAEEMVQKHLDSYRVRTWRKPLLGYDARQYNSPLHYRGAADLWRRKRQLFQCLDFAQPYRKLKAQHEKYPENERIARQYSYSLFDHKTCVLGFQCPGLQQFALWCLHNPSAHPDQVDECIQTLPQYEKCSVAGYVPPLASIENSLAFLPAAASGKSRKHLEAGRRLKAWLVNAEKITSARRSDFKWREIYKEGKNGEKVIDRNAARRDFIEGELLEETMGDYPVYNHDILNELDNDIRNDWNSIRWGRNGGSSRRGDDQNYGNYNNDNYNDQNNDQNNNNKYNNDDFSDVFSFDNDQDLYSRPSYDDDNNDDNSDDGDNYNQNNKNNQQDIDPAHVNELDRPITYRSIRHHNKESQRGSPALSGSSKDYLNSILAGDDV